MYLEEISTPLAKTLGLSKLPQNADVFAGSFLLFLFIHQVVAPAASNVFFPVAFGRTGRRARNNWSIHVVSQVHTLLVIPLAAKCLNLPSLDKDRAFGYDSRAAFVQAIACGYFLWDTLDAIINFTDLGFVVHGLACLLVYTLGFKPFLQYYAIRCLFWESSTFFLNIHWFLDKTGRTGSTFQLINGICLLATFFGVRIVSGGKMSYDFFHTLYEVRNQVSPTYLVLYGLMNVILQGLNWFWFFKMISALRKRFSDDAHANGKVANGKHVNGRHVTGGHIASVQNGGK